VEYCSNIPAIFQGYRRAILFVFGPLGEMPYKKAQGKESTRKRHFAGQMARLEQHKPPKGLGKGRRRMNDQDSDQTAVAGLSKDGERGVDRVRRVLIDPLIVDGLTRARGVTVEAHGVMLDKLCHRLAYLDAALLEVLREAVLRLAEGALRNQWPAFATIWNTAVRLQSPPDVELPIMTTWLTSIEGPRAQAGGYIVELRAWLRKHGRPPGSYDVVQIKASADENRRRLARLREAAELGRCSADDLGWIEDYELAQARCDALVSEGKARRAAAQVELASGAVA
jgi:hypothetical protein